jgi:hypothetical protein
MALRIPKRRLLRRYNLQLSSSTTKVYDGDKPVGFVLAANAKRHHLATHELAFLGA